MEYLWRLLEVAKIYKEIRIVFYSSWNSSSISKTFSLIENCLDNFATLNRIPMLENVETIISLQALFYHLANLRMVSESTFIFSHQLHFFNQGFLQFVKDQEIAQNNSPRLCRMDKLSSILVKAVKTLEKSLLKRNPLFPSQASLIEYIDSILNSNSWNAIKGKNELDLVSESNSMLSKSTLYSEKVCTFSAVDRTYEHKSAHSTDSSIDATTLSKSTSGTVVDSQQEKSEEESTNAQQAKILVNYSEDPLYQEMTNQFLVKLLSHYKTKPKPEWTSFINSLENLLAQHYGKMSKKNAQLLNTVWPKSYFIFIRNLLIQKGFISGLTYELWVRQNVNTLEEMNNSTKAFINLKNLEKYVSTIEVKSTKNITGQQKIFKLIDSELTYACITYTIIKTLSEKRFYHDIGSETNLKKYTKVIENLLKNLYNARSLPQPQKSLIKKDKVIKYLILKVLENNGIYEVKSKTKIEFSEIRIEQSMRDYAHYSSEELVESLQETIKSLVDSQLTEFQ